MTVFIVGMDYLIVKISNCKQYTALIIMALLFAAPKTIFRESVAWTAGFSNYTTSITLFILYIYLITCVFVNQSVSKYRFAVRAASLLLLGYLSAMVVEHVTIMQIILGIGIACYAWIKKDKSRIMCCFYPVGSILGAATMFSNGCYAAAAAGTDFYRNIPTGPEAVYDKMCLQYFDMLGKEMILDNIVLELFVAIVITVLCFQKIGGGGRTERTTVCFGSGRNAGRCFGYVWPAYSNQYFVERGKRIGEIYGRSCKCCILAGVICIYCFYPCRRAQKSSNDYESVWNRVCGWLPAGCFTY